MISDLYEGVFFAFLPPYLENLVPKAMDVDFARREIDNGGIPEKKCRAPPLTKAHSHGMYLNNLE